MLPEHRLDPREKARRQLVEKQHDRNEDNVRNGIEMITTTMFNAASGDAREATLRQ